MNKSLPPFEVLVKNSFLLDSTKVSKKKLENSSYGHLVSVRALPNQSLQFSVLLRSGGLYTGLPTHALGFSTKAPKYPLKKAIMWDNISGDIDVLTLDLLKYMSCSVKLTDGSIEKGIYLFTIDYVGTNDLSCSPEHWKQTHVIKLDNGGFIVYPQYRIRFLDEALCWESDEKLPPFKYNTTTWAGGS